MFAGLYAMCALFVSQKHERAVCLFFFRMTMAHCHVASRSDSFQFQIHEALIENDASGWTPRFVAGRQQTPVCGPQEIRERISPCTRCTVSSIFLEIIAQLILIYSATKRFILHHTSLDLHYSFHCMFSAKRACRRGQVLDTNCPCIRLICLSQDRICLTRRKPHILWTYDFSWLSPFRTLANSRSSQENEIETLSKAKRKIWIVCEQTGPHLGNWARQLRESLQPTVQMAEPVRTPGDSAGAAGPAARRRRGGTYLRRRGRCPTGRSDGSSTARLFVVAVFIALIPFLVQSSWEKL